MTSFHITLAAFSPAIAAISCIGNSRRTIAFAHFKLYDEEYWDGFRRIMLRCRGLSINIFACRARPRPGPAAIRAWEEDFWLSCMLLPEIKEPHVRKSDSLAIVVMHYININNAHMRRHKISIKLISIASICTLNFLWERSTWETLEISSSMHMLWCLARDDKSYSA